MFLDLDDIWLSRQLLLVDGLAFGTKPIKLLSPQRVPQRKLLVSGSTLRLNVGLVAGQEPQPALATGSQPVTVFWCGKLPLWVAGHNSVARDRNHTLWLSSTHFLHDYIEQHALQPFVLPVHQVSPWPLWMTDFLVAGNHYQVTLLTRNQLPDLELIRQEGVFVNLRESHWLASTGGEKARDPLAQVRDQRNLSGGLSLRTFNMLTSSALVQSRGPHKLQPPSLR